MARMEFQISTPVLLEAVLQIVEPRLYAQCFVSPIMGLCLDHVEAGVMGPITQPSKLVPSALNVAVSVKIFAATAEAVQAAKGGSPAISVKPDGVPLTANFVVSISGTKLTAKYNGIVQDDSYTSLEQLVAGFVGGQANAKQLFSRWEGALKTALAGISLLNFDLKGVLPPQFKNLKFGRSALSADSKVFAARLEVGADGSDGSWQDFEVGSPGDLIEGHDWGLFISGDVLVGVIDGLVQELVDKAAGVVPAVAGTFGLLGGSGPLPYSPLAPIAPETASVTTTATINYTVTESSFLGSITDAGTVTFTATLIFTVNEGPASLDTSLYYSVQNQLGGFLGTLAGLFGIGLNVPLPSGFVSVFSATDVPNFFTSQTVLPPVVLEKMLTLTVAGCTGTVEPPVSSFVQQLLDSLSTGTLDGQPVPVGWQIFATGSGLLIFGKAAVASGKPRPDCGVSSTPFFLVYKDVVNGPPNKPPTPANVPAVATFSVYNKGPNASARYPLLIGTFIPFPDPAAQWYQAPSLFPKIPHKAANIVITIPEAQFRPAYMEAPYPLSLIVCTNGGARFVSLGGIPAPEIDPATGFVDNAEVIMTFLPQTPVSGGLPAGPQHPVTSNKAPGG